MGVGERDEWQFSGLGRSVKGPTERLDFALWLRNTIIGG